MGTSEHGTGLSLPVLNHLLLSVNAPIIGQRFLNHLGAFATQCQSLPDAELAEDHVEHVLDVHAPGDAAEGSDGEAEILGGELRQFGLQ